MYVSANNSEFRPEININVADNIPTTKNERLRSLISGRQLVAFMKPIAYCYAVKLLSRANYQYGSLNYSG